MECIVTERRVVYCIGEVISRRCRSHNQNHRTNVHFLKISPSASLLYIVQFIDTTRTHAWNGTILHRNRLQEVHVNEGPHSNAPPYDHFNLIVARMGEVIFNECTEVVVGSVRHLHPGAIWAGGCQRGHGMWQTLASTGFVWTGPTAFLSPARSWQRGIALPLPWVVSPFPV